ARAAFLASDSDQYIANFASIGPSRWAYNIVSKRPGVCGCNVPIGDDHGNNSSMSTRFMKASQIDGVVINLALGCGRREPSLRLDCNDYVVHQNHCVDTLADTRDRVFEQNFEPSRL